MNQVISIMKDYQFSEYETLVYIELLKKANQTGYEVSKNSGVPRSKVYTTLNTLLKKELIISSSTDPVLYMAQPVEKLLELLKGKTEADFNEIEISLSNVETFEETETLWRFSEYTPVIDKVQTLIASCQEDLYLQIWEDDLTEELINLLTKAEKRVENFIVILFSNKHRYELPFDRFYKHGFEENKLEDYGSRWINLVVDSEEMVYGTLPDKEIDVIWTRNHSMVKLAKEYIIHDAYNLRMIEQLENPAKKIFGKDLMDVRNIYKN